VPGILPLLAPLARTKRRNVSMNRAEAAGIMRYRDERRNNKKKQAAYLDFFKRMCTSRPVVWNSARSEANHNPWSGRTRSRHRNDSSPERLNVRVAA
jgi:aspartyl/asparaginyl beta-hydroxylase (cupin superfamily)